MYLYIWRTVSDIIFLIFRQEQLRGVIFIIYIYVNTLKLIDLQFDEIILNFYCELRTDWYKVN